MHACEPSHIHGFISSKTRGVNWAVCGITGIYAARLEPDVARRTIETMTNALAHRGPDGHGYFLDDNVALGHRRLSIIDLGGGDQPIFNEDRSIAIVFNGEIYNYIELRNELIKQGHRFATASDTEVIVHLYEQKGLDCLQDLNGMFAFALWDSKRKRLFVARDRLGEKPLYYSFQNGTLSFASELKSILRARLHRHEVDLQAVDMYLAYGYVPSPRSIFSDVVKLPAAHYLTIEAGQLNVKRYWVSEMTQRHADISEAAALEQFAGLLDDSISIRLRSDVPVGAFLSGGIDSSLIVARAATLSGAKLHTFSVGFSEQDYDELGWARKVAERYNTDHHEFILKDIDGDLFPRIVEHFDEPFADPSAFPTYYVCKEASKHVKVTLSGDGGDELFCGYSRYNPEPFEKVLNFVPQPVRGGIFGAVDSLWPSHMAGKGWLRRMAAKPSDRWQLNVGIFGAEDRANLWRTEHRARLNLHGNIFDVYFDGKVRDVAAQQMLADQNTYLCDDILVKVDRDSMWHGLEARVPFLDHRMVEFANGLPVDFKRRNGVQKYPLKMLLRGRVPDELITRPKSGFGCRSSIG